MKAYLKLMRPKHYIKNFLIFVPLFFNKTIFLPEKLIPALLGFVAFSLVCSVIYINNDLQDVEKDRQHPKKCKRPIASGEVSEKQAKVLAFACVVVAIGVVMFAVPWQGALFLFVYAVLNLGYSFGLKNKPIIDVVILTSGFVLRVVYGAAITGIEVSGWLYLTVFAAAFFLSLGKRRNEVKRMGETGETREVLKYYTYDFLDRNMYVCLALLNTFYALWAVEQQSSLLLWTVPVVMVIMLKYSLVIEGDSDGDPVEVLLHDPLLLGLCAVYAVMMLAVLYF